MKTKPISVPDILVQKNRKPIVMLTAYDHLTAKILDDAGIEIILVGDSVGTTMMGFSTTLPVGMPEMIHHVKSVTRAVQRALVIADMPFGSYQLSEDQAVEHAISFIKAGAHGVKLEGSRFNQLIRRLVDTGIPVMGHIGLTPQSVNIFGGYKVQGKKSPDQKRILQDAHQLEAAGVFSIVIEGVPAKLAELITNSVKIPTIGIGAGPHCDGQVLVITDLLGLDPSFKPKFVRRYANLYDIISSAVSHFQSDVVSKSFPSEDEFYDDVDLTIT